ncbi:YhcN/YlaJ family sporulation lipoprotein [Sporosarcina gallistercoris]|uniref:YhcN/YlaJ family sporulation lipoprotein n=1 Tax=Sporosarcina gallistercoris TaxID=2762245 RepID=A0ABR8PFT3_9BACL|nr:YhcN/YlaJ family sporulation lipoprotein [Sporosarcina gallistercoris]MBD7907036.1 YhcN/YlaJ family sporulation lipoprotein [Sporosarcina gallistercoris]
MKKFWMVFAACLLMLSLAACGKKDKNTENQTNDTGVVENENDTTTDMDGTNDDTADDNTLNDQTVENADEIADAVASLEEVDHASVLKMNNSAYVGATLKEGATATKELEDKIADKAKEAGADTDKVYVSTNPDFTKQIDDYSDKIRNGEPVEGLFTEIGDALKRMFPDAH